MQQASHDSGLVNTFQPYLDELVAYVQEKCPNAKLVWHMTWAYQADSDHKAFPTYGNDQHTMYYGIINAVQKNIDPNENFVKTIPSGTMIQNLRGSMLGDRLTRDGYHLNDMARLAAAYTWYAVLADQKLQDMKFSNTGKTALDDKTVDLIVKAINAAVEKPYGVTPIV
jgi:hypothetical protein